MNPELIDWIWRGALGLVGMLVVYFIKDRRRTQLENKLADETLQPKAKKAGIEALESQILAMSNAWDHERESMVRQIRDLEARLADKDQKLEVAKDTIDQMSRQAQEMQDQLESFKRQLTEFSALMDEKEKQQ